MTTAKDKPGSGIYSPTKIAKRAEAEAEEARDELLTEIRGQRDYALGQVVYYQGQAKWLMRLLIGFLVGGGTGGALLRSNVGGLAEMLLSDEAVAEIAAPDPTEPPEMEAAPGVP